MNTTSTPAATECNMCRYTSGHTSWCPNGDGSPLVTASPLVAAGLGAVTSIDDPRVTSDPAERAVLLAAAARLDALPTDDEPDAPMIAERWNPRRARIEFRAYPQGRAAETGGAGAWYATREQAQAVLAAALD